MTTDPVKVLHTDQLDGDKVELLLADNGRILLEHTPEVGEKRQLDLTRHPGAAGLKPRLYIHRNCTCVTLNGKGPENFCVLSNFWGVNDKRKPLAPGEEDWEPFTESDPEVWQDSAGCASIEIGETKGLNDEILLALRQPLKAELSGYAAEAALLELEKNWAQALKDGETPKIILSDLDEVIAVLQTMKESVSPIIQSKGPDENETVDRILTALTGADSVIKNPLAEGARACLIQASVDPEEDETVLEFEDTSTVTSSELKEATLKGNHEFELDGDTYAIFRETGVRI